MSQSERNRSFIESMATTLTSPFRRKTGTAQPRSLSRHRPQKESYNDVEIDPLQQAKEIQNEGNGSGKSKGRDHSRRENHKRPSQMPRPFTSSLSDVPEPSHQRLKRGNSKKRRRTQPQPERTQSQTVVLCATSSNSDTDCDSDNRVMSASSLLPPSSSSPSPTAQNIERKSDRSESKSSRNNKFRKNLEDKQRRQPSIMPKYPSSRLLASTNTTQEQNDNENDCVIMPNDTKEENGDSNGRTNSKSKKKRQKSHLRSDTNEGSFLDEVEEENSKNEQTSPKMCTDKREEPIPRKKLSPPQKYFGANIMEVPALKPISLKRAKNKQRKKNYDDVKDMNSGCDEDNCDNNDAKTVSKYITDMKDVINAAGSCSIDVDNDELHNIMSTSRTTTDHSSATSGMSPSTSRCLGNMKKVNSKGSKGRTKGRKGSRIVPGASFSQRKNRPQQNEEQSMWRIEKDRDEYHASNKETQLVWRSEKDRDTLKKEPQAEDALRWDPLKGGSYRNTRSASIRRSNHYGTSTKPLTDGMNSSPRRRLSRMKKQKKPETIDLLNSDSEDEDVIVAEEEECDVFKFPLKRLAVGDKRVYNNQDHQPIISFNNEKRIMEITYSKSKAAHNIREKIDVNIFDIEELFFWAIGDTPIGLNADLDSFIVVRADVSMKAMSKRKGDITKTSKELVLEFEDDQQMNDLVLNAKDYIDNKILPVPPDDLDIVAASLISDSKKKYNLRSRVTPHEIDAFISNRRSDEILLVYPFEVDKNKLEAVADGLKELSWSEKSQENQDLVESNNDNKLDSAPLRTDNESSENVLTTMQSGQRSHFIEIRVDDYEKLDTGQWLNDSLIDLWMQWISRHITCKQSSNFHFFTSHFYTTLASEGVMGVRSWTAKKNIDIFEKRLIFIPINKTLHWSLCVIVNPGAIMLSSDNDNDKDFKDRPLPCMLFFDSLNMHRKARVHRDVVKWLNSEWKRTKNSKIEPFTRQSCKMYDPQVPRQNNGSDCGVFVCRYAFAMFQLRHLKFSHQDAGLGKIDNREGEIRRQRDIPRSQFFSDLITNGKEFDFNVDDIQRIRREFKTLIRNLHPVYQVVKDGRIKAEKEEKKARKRRKENGAETAQITESIENNTVETCSYTATSNLNGTPGGATNYLSKSSKENGGEENLAQMTRRTDAEEKQVGCGLLISEASMKQQSSSRTPVTDDTLGLNSKVDDMAGIVMNSEKMDHALPTSFVDKEEMADRPNIVHL